MFKLIKTSFKAKIVLIVTISIVLSGTGISTVILKSQYDSQLNQMKVDGVNIAKITAKNIEAASIQSTEERVQNVVEELGTSNGIQYTALIDINMIDVIDSQKEEIGKSFADDEATIETVKYKKDSPSFYIDPTGSTVLDIQVPVDFKVGDNQIAAVDIGVSMDGLYENIHKSIIKSCILTIAFIIMFSIIPIMIINHIAIKPLKEGLKLAESIAHKDLRLCISSNSKDDIGAIITSIEQAKDNLKDIICEVQVSSEEVTSATEVLYLSLNSINNNTQNMTIFVDDILRNIQGNIYIIKEANTEIQGIVLNSNKTEEISKQLSSFMKNINESALKGKNSIEDIIGTISEIDDSSNKVNNFILELEKETAQIEDVINAITEISEQTNLAEQSRQSLKGVIELTQNIRNKIQKAVEMITITTDKINKGVTQANIAGNNINKIIENINSADNSISMISKITVTQSCSIKNVQEFMEEIISIAGVNADKAQEMNTDMEEQMSVLEEVNAISNELENMSVNLTILVSEFKVF